MDAHPRTTSEHWLADLIAADAGSGLDDGALARELVARGVAVGEAVLDTGELGRSRKTSVSDIVTVADHRAEADIVAALAALRPEDGIIGEEGAARDSRSGRTWIIDPIDGTYNFAHRIAGWCSAIALREGEVTLAGAVRRGGTGEAWLARAGEDGPGMLWRNGDRMPRLAPAPLAEVGIATYLHPTRMTDPDAWEPWRAAAAGAATVRMLGSGSLDLADVAAGRLGAFMQSGTADWDWYPGVALVEAAGGIGRVVGHRGHRWHVAGNERVVAELIARLTGA